MVEVSNEPIFEKKIGKIKSADLLLRVKKQIKKIIKNPEIGKPMMYSRKGAREAYVSPFRLSYAYLKEEDHIIFLDLYHKDKQ